MQLPNLKVPIHSVTDYLNWQPDHVYHALANIRNIIKVLVPKAEETISCITMTPTYKYKGLLVGFGATKKQCSFFVMSSIILKKYEDDLKDYETTSKTIHFTPDHPIPNDLLVRIILARVAENESKNSKNN